MKKLFALMLCLALAASLASAAFAAGCAHTHKHLVTVVDRDYPIYSMENPDDPNYDEDPLHCHWAIYEAWEYWECDACGERFSGKPLPDQDVVEQQLHVFVDGVCACGYPESGPATDEFYPEDKYEIERGKPYTSINDLLHECTIYNANTGEKIGTTIENHEYENGVCTRCGHRNECTHPKPYASRRKGDPDFHYLDEKHCQGTYKNAYLYIWCALCGKEIDDEYPIDDYEKTEEHDYRENDDGDMECEFCHHVIHCDHDHTTAKEYYGTDEWIDPWVKDADASGHVLWGQWTVIEYVCDDCGYVVNREYVDSRKTETKAPHDYNDHGYCTVCGFKDPNRSDVATPEATATPTVAPTATPTAAPTAAPTATPEPAGYVPVSADTAIHGVKASDGLTAAAAMRIIGQTLDGEGASVSIPDFERLLSADELERFNRLSVEERLLVTLSALGYGDSEGLSAEAQALAEELADRLAGMGTVAVEPWSVTVNDREYDAVRIQVEITQNGRQTRERYTLYDDDGQWMLYGVEVWE